MRASELIQAALSGVSQAEFLKDWEKQSAVERQLMIIGEALVRIRIHEPSVLELIPEWGAVIRLRNLLVHAYDSADPEIIYGIAGAPLTDLRLVAEQLLSSS